MESPTLSDKRARVVRLRASWTSWQRSSVLLSFEVSQLRGSQFVDNFGTQWYKSSIAKPSSALYSFLCKTSKRRLDQESPFLAVLMKFCWSSSWCSNSFARFVHYHFDGLQLLQQAKCQKDYQINWILVCCLPRQVGCCEEFHAYKTEIGLGGA